MTWKELDAKLREGCEQDREQRQRANAHKALAKALGAALPEEFEVAESGRLAQLLAKRRSNGQMQISAELVPIPDASGCVPDASRMRPDASGCVGMRRDFEFQQLSANFQFWQNSGKFGAHVSIF